MHQQQATTMKKWRTFKTNFKKYSVLDETPKKTIIVEQGDWNAKIGADAAKDWEGICGSYCNNNRGLRLVEFASYNDLKVMNTFRPHKASRRWTWRSPRGDLHQIDNIMVKHRFHTGVNIAETRSFSGDDIGSNHNLEMMTLTASQKV